MRGEAGRRVRGLARRRQGARRAERIGFDEVTRAAAAAVVLRQLGRGSVSVEVMPKGSQIVVVGATVGVGVGVASLWRGVVRQ